MRIRFLNSYGEEEILTVLARFDTPYPGDDWIVVHPWRYRVNGSPPICVLTEDPSVLELMD